MSVGPLRIFQEVSDNDNDYTYNDCFWLMSFIGFRPSSNKKLFPVHRPGGLKRADWNFFFFLFSFFFLLFPLYILVYKK